MPLYNDESDIHLIKSYPFDMKMVNLIYVSHFQWMMGYPERALRTKADADAWAKRLNNPFMFAFADIWGSGVFHYAGRLDEHRQQLQDGIEISKRIGMPFWVAQAEMWSAWNQASTRNHKSLSRRPLTRRWWTFDLVHMNGSAVLL